MHLSPTVRSCTGDDRSSPDTPGSRRRHAHPRADGTQPEALTLSRGRQRQPAAEGPLARPAGHRDPHGHERPLLGAPANRAQPGAAPVPAVAPRGPGVRDRARLRRPTRTPRWSSPAAACCTTSGCRSTGRPRGYSLFLAADLLAVLLEKVLEEPERTVVSAGIMHAIIGHRKGGRPLTLEAGVVRVADALDMEQGRSRVAFETSLPTSTRCRRRRSTRSGSSWASSARCASRSR